jgi:hypothetical protein
MTLAAILLLVGALLPATILHAQDDSPASPAPGRGSRGGGVGVPAAPLTPGMGPTASFAATIYEVRMPADQIGRIDIEALTSAAATTAGFEKALGTLGAARALYYVNQSVRVADDSIRIGASTPYVTNSQINNKGDVINSVAYTALGATFTLSGKAKGAGNVDLNLIVQVGTLTDGGVAIAANVSAPYFRSAVMDHKGLVKTGQPFVLVSADGAALDAEGKAVAYISKVTLGPLQ